MTVSARVPRFPTTLCKGESESLLDSPATVPVLCCRFLPSQRSRNSHQSTVLPDPSRSVTRHRVRMLIRRLHRQLKNRYSLLGHARAACCAFRQRRTNRVKQVIVCSSRAGVIILNWHHLRSMSGSCATDIERRDRQRPDKLSGQAFPGSGYLW
jgi:hypothetical protein